MREIAWFVSPLGTHGGTFVHLSQWAQHLDKEKYNVTLICSRSTELDIDRIKTLEAYGIEVVILPNTPLLGLGYASVVSKLAKLLKVKRVTLLHTVFIQADIIGSIAARIAGVPFIVSSLEGRLVPLNCSRWKQLVYRWAYPVARNSINRTIAISHETGREAIYDFGVNPDCVTVIYNGIEPQRFSPRQYLGPSKRRLLARAPVLGYFGALSCQKGLDSLIEALPLVLNFYPAVKLLIVGEGPDRSRLEWATQELGLQDVVTFESWVDDVSRIMSDFDILVLPSKSEGMPWAVLEAMASAKPVIATAVGGIPEAVVDGETGILLSNSKPETIARAVLSMLDSPERTLQMGYAGRRRIEDRFTTSIEMRKIEALYDSLTEGGEDFLQGPPMIGGIG